ncbi:hypothetical protein LZD49_33590 [Dyadobacter sp. CY261]|uniref:hypothetical protein n=1 Tax=Dyadobacter sp. CY261 TaxID=2907203 RepID=UPI001F486579|nr:hypothetical protein [Dyadobacter sp. CY261]MCF0075461.1 hypothetical protein [Dyadobacter sp. CY261]
MDFETLWGGFLAVIIGGALLLSCSVGMDVGKEQVTDCVSVYKQTPEFCIKKFKPKSDD